MRTAEWVTTAYFAYLFATGVLRRAPRGRMVVLAGAWLATLAVIAASVVLASLKPISVLRDWLPGGYLLAGYWATGLLYRGPSDGLERALAKCDDRVFEWLGPAILRAPRAILETLESAYLFCYPLVPAGLAVLYIAGQRARADAYWVLVLAAAFAAYAPLPWAGTRPPRQLGCNTWIDRRSVAVRRLNLRILERGSIHVNTFPSGHAAAAWAAALFMLTIDGRACAVFFLMAAAIGAGAVVGRYHYLIDVVAGIAVAGTAWAVGLAW